MKSTFIAMPDLELRDEIIKKLLRAYAANNMVLVDEALQALALHYNVDQPKVVYGHRRMGRSTSVGETVGTGKTIRLMRPPEWRERVRFSSALEWAKTVLHEFVHAVVKRHEEELAREYEASFTDDIELSAGNFTDGLT